MIVAISVVGLISAKHPNTVVITLSTMGIAAVMRLNQLIIELVGFLDLHQSLSGRRSLIGVGDEGRWKI
jgi:hypothetical protein